VLGNTQVNCLAGIRPQGVDDATVEKTFVANLKYAADKLQAAGIKLVMEAINTRDIPGFYLNNTAQALSIREQVGSANLFLQYDIYHMQIMEGDLARTLQSHLAEINHVQLADNPGATSRAPARSTTASCSNTWTASAIRAGSAANTSR
jgi:hydroxypyruvate isomerase